MVFSELVCQRSLFSHYSLLTLKCFCQGFIGEMILGFYQAESFPHHSNSDKYNANVQSKCLSNFEQNCDNCIYIFTV